jgi:hypothetical protein
VFLLKISDKSSLIVEKEERWNGGEASLNLCHMTDYHRSLNLSKGLKSYEFRVLNVAGSVAVLAPYVRVARQRGAQALSRHLEKSKLRETSELDSRLIGSDGVLKSTLNGAPMTFVDHVDEIDND